MPLTNKGKTILTAMESEYGAKEGKSHFYASINSGRIKGAEKTRRRPKPSKGSK